MTTLIEKLKQLLNNQTDSDADTVTIADETAVQTLMSLIQQTKEGEYTCDETFDLLDEYAELVADDPEAAALMPLVKEHISHCLDCEERYDVLMQILAAPMPDS